MTAAPTPRPNAPTVAVNLPNSAPRGIRSTGTGPVEDTTTRMMMSSGPFHHTLTLKHERQDIAPAMGDQPPADSRITVNADGRSLVECVKEVLSRLPNDVYAAFQIAITEVIPDDD